MEKRKCAYCDAEQPIDLMEKLFTGSPRSKYLCQKCYRKCEKEMNAHVSIWRESYHMKKIKDWAKKTGR